MKKLVINAEMCEGHGRCYEIAPSLVDSDDRGRGMVIVDSISDEHLADVNPAGVVARGHKLQQLFDAAGVLQASQDDKISAGTIGRDAFTRVVNCGQ